MLPESSNQIGQLNRSELIAALYLLVQFDVAQHFPAKQTKQLFETISYLSKIAPYQDRKVWDGIAASMAKLQRYSSMHEWILGAPQDAPYTVPIGLVKYLKQKPKPWGGENNVYFFNHVTDFAKGFSDGKYSQQLFFLMFRSLPLLYPEHDNRLSKEAKSKMTEHYDFMFTAIVENIIRPKRSRTHFGKST